ncbi:MAG TPA: signal peptide peptidase SppA [Bacteroidia bacterium]|nr:signal peptide peptidase SppA [Bacteroidia bacterium]
MGQFFKFMFASALGMLLMFILLFFIFLGMVGALVSSAGGEKSTTISANSILEIKLDEPLTERTPNNPLKNLKFPSLETSKQLGVYDIVKNIEKAGTDESIKGIYLDVSNIQGGLASIEEIRNALLRFKESKKFIIAYSEDYAQTTYYLCSVADKIYLNPQGAIDFKGFFTELAFFKGMLEKLEIQPEVIRHGKFKSAVEPFIADKMSPENREQIKTFVDAMWNHTVEGIAQSRKKSAEQIMQIADSLKVQQPEDAVTYGLADQLAYQDEVEKILKEKTGISSTGKLNLVSLGKYNHVPEKLGDYVSDKIAIVFAAGAIGSGEGDDEQIGSETTAAAIHKARLDKNVKAIVLRVNSPGGSALASEVIWRETELAQKVKPVVVSMGNLAASGGYYISCAADTIVAQPNTITGSIGVFGVLFNIKNMLNNKLGITTDIYKTGNYSDIGMPTHPLSDAERKIIQNSVEDVYSTFIKHVADGRGMTTAEVDSIGQGRVWSGIDAKRLGLVDVLGGFNDAIKIAAKMAKLDNYRITELPVQKDPIEELIKDMKGDAEASYVKKNFGDAADYLKSLKDILNMRGVQARMMFDVVIK